MIKTNTRRKKAGIRGQASLTSPKLNVTIVMEWDILLQSAKRLN